MKSKTLSFFFSSIFILVLLLGFISAYNVNYPVYSATVEDNLSLTKTLTSVNNLTVIGYKCWNSACTSIDTANPVAGLSVPVINNIVPTVFPSTYYSLGYVLYFYKPGYIGWVQMDNAWGTGFDTGANIYLSKKRNSGAQIFNFLVDTNSGLTFATIDSAIKTTQFSTVPLLEKVYTTVNFKINNSQTGQIVNTASKDYLIPYSLNQDVNFSYNFSQLASGNYTVTIFTDVNNEDKIINKIVYSVSHDITLISNNNSNQTNSTNSTSPIITVTSPVNGGNYTNASIVYLNATSDQLVSWNYTLNGNNSLAGTNLAIIIPLNSVNLVNGSNTLIVFAGNSNGTVNQTIIFNYNLNGTNGNSSNLTLLPSLTILSPNQTNYNTTLIPVVINSINAQNVWFNINGGSNLTYNGSTNVNVFYNGTYTLFAYANNSVGNMTSRNVTFNVNTSMVDTTGPVITVYSPENIVIRNSTVFVNFSATDPSNVSALWYFNGSANRTISFESLNLADGAYVFTFYANDTFNNINSVIVNFRVNTSSNSIIDNNDDDDEDGDSDHNEGEILNFGANSNYSISESNSTIGLLDLTSKKQSLTSAQWVLYWLFLLILILLLILVLILIFRRINQ